jgi:hypothetical protein
MWRADVAPMATLPACDGPRQQYASEGTTATDGLSKSEEMPIGAPQDDASRSAAPGQIDAWRKTPVPDTGEDEWQIRQRRRRRLATAAVVTAVALALALAIGGFVWMAELHYARGQKAYAMGAYDWAVSEFAAAHILVFPFRNAAGMERAAKAALVRQTVAAKAKDEAETRLVTAYRDAEKKLAANDAEGVRADLESARAAGSRGPLGDDPEVQAVASDLQMSLRLNAVWSLEASNWHRAGLYASLVLMLDPANSDAKSIARKAAAGEALQARFARALAAARAHRWRTALALALSVLHARPGFPGASNLVAQARVALRPKPAAARAPSVSASAPTTSSPATPSKPNPPPP